MAFKRFLPADAYTIGLIYVMPLDMNVITVMLDGESKLIPLPQGERNAYTLGRIGKHNVAVVGPPRGAQGTVAIADAVRNIQRTFKNMTLGLLVGLGEACHIFLSMMYDWEMSSLEPQKTARQWCSMTWERKRTRDLK